MPTPTGYSTYGSSGTTGPTGATGPSVTGTTGQAFLGNGSAAAGFSAAIPFLARDLANTGAAPAAPGPFSMVAGVQSVTFVAGTGPLTFTGGGFPNGVLTVFAEINSSGTADIGTISFITKTGCVLSTITALSATTNVDYLAIGF